MRAQLVNEFVREVELTPDQENKVGAIIDDTRAQMRSLYAPLGAQGEKIRRQSDDRIRAILMPEQLSKFERFMQRIHEQRKAYR